ncbi:hypothetical protein QC760_006766 [Botrytis cinerea]
MRTMAQFGIRDAEGGLSDVTETMEPRSGIPSVRNGSIVEEQERERQRAVSQHSFALPTGISEMPADNYDEPSMRSSHEVNYGMRNNDDTPPANLQPNHFEMSGHNFDGGNINFDNRILNL